MTPNGKGGSREVRFATPRELVAVCRYEWGVRNVWKTRCAMLRGLWWTFVRRYAYELCEDCGRPVGCAIGGTFWRADDELWRRVVGSRHGILCVADFTARAEAFGINVRWEPHV